MPTSCVLSLGLKAPDLGHDLEDTVIGHVLGLKAPRDPTSYVLGLTLKVLSLDLT